MRRTRLRVFLSRLLDVVSRRRRESRLADEIQSHLDQLSDQFLADGMSAADAHNAARRAFGGVDQVKETYRDQRGLPMLDSLLQDVRFGLRLLVKERSFTAGAVLVLGLGLGVNTTIFTIINGMSWRGLPVADAGEIIQVTTQELHGSRQQTYTSHADFRDWQSATQTFAALAAYASGSMNIGDADRPADRVGGWFISANTFGVLGVRPILGRDFIDSDDRPGAAPVAILSHRVWRTRYEGDGGIIGHVVRINGAPAAIVGVMAEGFEFPARADIWQPASQQPAFDATKRDHRTFNVFGRLRKNATLAQARLEFTTLTAALAAQHPDTNEAIGAYLVPYTESYVGPPTEGPPLVMMVAGLLVLLLACANAANLLLTRAMHRTRE
ncbi:MAG: ABC transporter permease, partial [Planctomycetota bacterium]|nr:ABC transporter permease [Planctomycetota bacterium]